MVAAVVNVCVDPRLDYQKLRPQVQYRLDALGAPNSVIYVTNEIGGVVGSSVRSTLALLRRRQQAVALVAVLYHDDCLAAAENLRDPLEKSVNDIRAYLQRLGIDCPVLSGTILTETNAITWTDQPTPNRESTSFRMPRMYGR